MAHTINYGIDLGTTNSLIACCTNGEVEVFRNPSGFRETLPSVVGFRKERTLVGEKAREYLLKDPVNVFSSFKRKMGTSESYFVSNIVDFRTPVQLSAMVLKELRNFVRTNDSLHSVVVTIPASFDTVQSNATREAGLVAGFTEVVLLQEPIAASLAFANKGNSLGKDGKWLVYDLGGGTFDVALVAFAEGEMKVLDHEGDNYLGGVDFDSLILEDIVVPYVETLGVFAELLHSLKSGSGSRNALYVALLYKAEEVKISLSSSESVDVEFEITDDLNQPLDVFLTITRDELNAVIEPRIRETMALASAMLVRNNVTGGSLREVILIGGSTYIPLVRQLLATELNLTVNVSVDPTTAVAVGAAWFASSRSATALPDGDNAAVVGRREHDISLKTAYRKNSNDAEEYFTAMVSGSFQGMYYRITRSDGGFDSGLKVLNTRISEMLILLPDSVNEFTIRVYDANQLLVDISFPLIVIVRGKYSIYGQPLPSDICIEVDDNATNTTYLEVIFEKNEILPLRKTITKTLSRTIVKGTDDQLVINVLEGSRYATAQTNLPIGVIAIKGTSIERDLIKGSDVDLTIEISENRDITISAWVSITDTEYKEVFSPSVRSVNIERLQDETDYLIRIGRRNLEQAVETEDFEGSSRIQDAIDALQRIAKRLMHISADDVTDEKYKLDEQKRKLAATINAVSKDSRLRQLQEDYFGWKAHTQSILSTHGSEALNIRFKNLVRDEAEFLKGSEAIIRRKIDDMRQLTWDIRKHDPQYVAGLYLHYALKDPVEYTDEEMAKQLVTRGDAALERGNVAELLEVIYRLYDLLIDKDEDEAMKGTGLA